MCKRRASEVAGARSSSLSPVLRGEGWGEGRATFANKRRSTPPAATPSPQPRPRKRGGEAEDRRTPPAGPRSLRSTVRDDIGRHSGPPHIMARHTLKITPIRFPRNEFADRIVSVSSAIAHTPSALAMYGPSPRRWNSS